MIMDILVLGWDDMVRSVISEVLADCNRFYRNMMSDRVRSMGIAKYLDLL